MGSLSNYEIESIAEHYGFPLKDCCMKDELQGSPKNGYYIINLESSTQGDGTHWTLLIVQPELALFFDSFGAPPSTEIIDFVKKRRGIHMAFNNEIIQDIDSSNCGFFCLYFIWYIEHCRKPLIKAANDFTDLFSEDTKRNDGILKQLFRHIPDRYPPKPVWKLLRKKYL
jgi:hypothetical protein